MPRYWRKIIRIQAADSPNVILGLAQRERGIEPTNEIFIPGVLTFDEYQKRRTTWDAIRQCVGLDAEFYEGAEVKMFPPLWLNRAATIAKLLALKGTPRRAKAIGCDPGEGTSETSWAVVDHLGLIELVSLLTPDTSVIAGQTVALMRKYRVEPEYVCFDRGGGGKEHADRLRSQGFAVRTVSFGEPLLAPIRYRPEQVRDKVETREERYAYVNRRAQMFGAIRQLLDPDANPTGYALPARYSRLFHELRPIPLTYDQEGRLYLLPKRNRDPNAKTPTLIDLIGHSPNDADALAVANHAMNARPLKARAEIH